MTVAAFVVSVVALLTSGWWSWRANLHAGRALAIAEEAARRPPWELRREDGSMHRLTNMTRRTAYDVGIGVEGPLHPYLAPDGDTIDDGAERTFSIGVGLSADTRRRITVRWRETPSGPVKDWTTGL